MPKEARERLIVGAVLVCFFLSGAAGLIYQVAWGKALGLIFGHTAQAVAIVLAVFMGGLAAGSMWLGRREQRWRRPLAVYGWLEVGTAVAGAFSFAGLTGVRALYIAADPHAADHGLLLQLLRVAGAVLVLFVPTFLMGGTLPVLVHALAQDCAELGKPLARLYWINTAGAVTGTLAAGFFLLQTIGLRATIATAVGLNLLAGMAGLLLSRAGIGSQVSDLPVRSERSWEASEFLLFCFALVGATAMSYEIGWTRLLATQLGSSTYAFTLMLATFLMGIVLGSVAFEWWCRRHEAKSSTFALSQTFTALAAVASLIVFPYAPELLPRILRATHASFGGLALAQFVISALTMLPVAVLLGFNFPVVTVLVAGPDNESSRSAAVGRAYAWNTMGAIAGALAAGFWLLPALGSFHLIASTAAANLAVAILLYVVATPRRVFAGGVNALLLAAVIAVGFSPFFYDPALTIFNTMLYWYVDGPLNVRENAHTMDVLYLADGVNSTISVTRSGDALSLRTNGKADASNQDIRTQLLAGHLGALANSSVHRVLVIGFGGGMTVSALSRYPELERLDCVEIEPAVLGAAPLLTSLNRNVLQDPRVHIIIDDARDFLSTSREKYDLIVSEPSNPWMAGIATLYTREFYRTVQEHLTPNGVFVQWVQAYSLFPKDVRMIAATFLSQFQGASLWHGEISDLLLMAPTPPAVQMLDRVGALWNQPLLRADFDQLDMEEPAGLFGLYLLGDSDLRAFSRGAPVDSDDFTWLEYRAPAGLLVQDLGDENHREILRAQSSVLPADIPADSRDAALDAAATTAMQYPDGASQFVTVLEGRRVTAGSAVVLGRIALSSGRLEAARHSFEQALALAGC